MTPQLHIVRAERLLREIKHALSSQPSSPRTREIRARIGTFDRALVNLQGRVPTEEQAAALLDAVLDLYAKAFPSERRPSRAVSLSSPALVALASQPPLRGSKAPTTPPVLPVGAASAPTPPVPSTPLNTVPPLPSLSLTMPRLTPSGGSTPPALRPTAPPTKSSPPSLRPTAPPIKSSPPST